MVTINLNIFIFFFNILKWIPENDVQSMLVSTTDHYDIHTLFDPQMALTRTQHYGGYFAVLNDVKFSRKEIGGTGLI